MLRGSSKQNQQGWGINPAKRWQHTCIHACSNTSQTAAVVPHMGRMHNTPTLKAPAQRPFRHNRILFGPGPRSSIPPPPEAWRHKLSLSETPHNTNVLISREPSTPYSTPSFQDHATQHIMAHHSTAQHALPSPSQNGPQLPVAAAGAAPTQHAPPLSRSHVLQSQDSSSQDS